MTTKIVSIICPVFNEQNSIRGFYNRLKQAIKPIENAYKFELIFTNNNSTDNTLEEIKSLRNVDSSVQVITLSRNFGYQASVLAGVTYANGVAIIVIDVDCEDPPELIPKFIDKWVEGYDVVYGQRMGRPESRWIILARKLFYRVLKFSADTNINLDMAEFSLFSSRVKNVMLKNKNSFPFLRAEIGYAGFKQYPIPYDRQLRIAGKSNYNIWGMLLFAIGGILSVSTLPLRLGAYIFPPIVVAHVIFLSFFLDDNDLFKFLIIFDAILFFYFLTFISLYMARIYKNNLDRPIFIVDWNLSELNNAVTEK